MIFYFFISFCITTIFVFFILRKNNLHIKIVITIIITPILFFILKPAINYSIEYIMYLNDNYELSSDISEVTLLFSFIISLICHIIYIFIGKNLGILQRILILIISTPFQAIVIWPFLLIIVAFVKNIIYVINHFIS